MQNNTIVQRMRRVVAFLQRSAFRSITRYKCTYVQLCMYTHVVYIYDYTGVCVCACMYVYRYAYIQTQYGCSSVRVHIMSAYLHT